ncbi:flagellar FliJ family protein [Simiduia sp. 21SJ11W-1]|uniref:flagellar export protein FliJ n=1 Tax=Simiduia sp. 21SJ11W-1 TaxID=2909669 RepID=UPI0020A0589B|nr:flagellar FliJ family protein [Simiduia sp. 21SJ11W-1]UTA49487.1 flagellar FliJ family protein [Simiduia sp. 21SJ11W-1]
MNTQLKRAQLLIKLAKRKEEQAGAVLAEWRERVATQRHQLTELAGYQKAYLAAAGEASQTVHQLQANRQFLSQLDGVISEQRLRMQQLEQQFEHYCRQWQGLHQRRKVLEDYRERLDLSAQKALNKMWDKLCDELAARPDAPQNR